MKNISQRIKNQVITEINKGESYRKIGVTINDKVGKKVQLSTLDVINIHKEHIDNQYK